MRHRPGYQRGWGFPLHPPNVDPEIPQGTRHAPGRSQGRGGRGLWGSGCPPRSRESSLYMVSNLSSVPTPQLRIHNSPTSVTKCHLLRGTNSQKCPHLQSPFGRFLLPKCTSLFRNLRYFYPSKPSAPLLPDSHPSFISRTGLDPAALEK